MPNWCHNLLTVTGDPVSVKAFADRVRVDDRPLSFEKLAATPSNDELPEGDGVMPGWYLWRLENWGTKWDASFNGPGVALSNSGADVDVAVAAQGAQQGDGVIVYKFDTAWGPPVPLVAKASESFAELRFELRYGEPGNGFAGRVVYVDGWCDEEEDLDVEDVLAPEDMWF